MHHCLEISEANDISHISTQRQNYLQKPIYLYLVKLTTFRKEKLYRSKILLDQLLVLLQMCYITVFLT